MYARGNRVEPMAKAYRCYSTRFTHSEVASLALALSAGRKRAYRSAQNARVLPLHNHMAHGRGGGCFGHGIGRCHGGGWIPSSQGPHSARLESRTPSAKIG